MIVECPHCFTTVTPSRDGVCPACRKCIHDADGTSSDKSALSVRCGSNLPPYCCGCGEMTERYVPRILAAKEILSNPKKYGFQYDKEDLYTLPKSYPVKVDTAITNIAAFAKKYGTHYKELKIHNPWLRENKLNNKSRKVYYISIPER